MKLPRWTHRLYAKAMHYFWLPCPVCGDMFGGHETWHYYGGHQCVIPVGGGAEMICPKCTRAGQGCYLSLMRRQTTCSTCSTSLGAHTRSGR